jgi:uncharacterized protein (TIGR02145 family)
MTMEMARGISKAEANGTGWRGTGQGTQMKTDFGWVDGYNGTNTSGFAGLPGGFRYNDGFFGYAGDNRSWWSSSPDGSNAWFRGLNGYYESVYRDGYSQRSGFFVRCVRDAE